MFSRVPQPLAFAEALLAQFGALSRETDIAALLAVSHAQSANSAAAS